MLCLELVVALLGVANYLKAWKGLALAQTVFVFISDIPGPCGPGSECASTVASLS